MKRYEVIEEAYQGNIRYVLSEILGVGIPLYEVITYDPQDPQGGYQAERGVYTTLKDAQTAMERMGLNLVDVSTSLYSHAQYTGEDVYVDEEIAVMEAA